MDGKLIKKDAKNVVLKNYKKIWLFYGVFAIIFAINTSLSLYNLFFTNSNQQLLERISFIPDPKILFVIALQAAIIGAIFIVSYYYSNRIKNEQVIDKKEIVSELKKRSFNLATLNILISFLLLLWSVLIIPYFIKIYSYSMALFIYRENDISYKEAIKRSRKMMNGNKLKLFIIDLSLLPLYIFSLFTLNLYLIWLLPYHFQIKYNFYLELKDEFAQSEVESTKKWDIYLAVVTLVIAMLIGMNIKKPQPVNIYDTINNNQCNYMEDKVFFNDNSKFIMFNPKTKSAEKLPIKRVRCFYQFDNTLYYSIDENVYVMDLTTLDSQLISEKTSGYFTTDNKKIYLQYDDKVTEFDIKTKSEKIIIKGNTVKGLDFQKFVSINMLNIDEEYLYYTLNEEEEFYRINRKTNEKELLINMAIANPKVYNNKIYYTIEAFSGSIYRSELDGSNSVEVITFSFGNIKLDGEYYYGNHIGSKSDKYSRININSQFPFKTKIDNDIQLMFVGEYITGIIHGRSKYYYIDGKKVIEVKLGK